MQRGISEQTVGPINMIMHCKEIRFYEWILDIASKISENSQNSETLLLKRNSVIKTYLFIVHVYNTAENDTDEVGLWYK